MTEPEASLRVGYGDWADYRRGAGPPAIPCVPFTMTLLGLLLGGIAWLASGLQLAFLPFCLREGGYCLSPLQLLGLASWVAQGRLWVGAERDLQAATQGAGAGNFTSVNTLARSGQFSFCRNPLYLVTLLLFAPSVGLLCNSAWFPAVCCTLQLLNYNLVVVPAEEALLRMKFGSEFEEYSRQVGRWCPWC